MDYGIDINRLTFIEYMQLVQVLLERNPKHSIGDEE